MKEAATAPPISVAVVDDEPALRAAVGAYLRRHDIAVVDCDNGRALDAALARSACDVVLLDVTMPGEDGFAIARRLRMASPDIGIVMLTARAELADRVIGLELGADDYLPKPFELRELLARVRAVARRSAGRRTAAAATPAVRTYFDALWVQERGMLMRIAVRDIDWIEADRDYVLLHVGDRAHALRATMDELERQLDPALMLRLHRSAFVPPAVIAAFRRQGRGGKVQLANGRMIAVGPGYVAAVTAYLADKDGRTPG